MGVYGKYVNPETLLIVAKRYGKSGTIRSLVYLFLDLPSGRYREILLLGGW
jgi:hypothetical protein